MTYPNSPEQKLIEGRQDQTEFGPQGNCQSACLATLLGVPVSVIPNFARIACEQDNDAAAQAQTNWLKDHGWGIVTIIKWQALPWPPKHGFYIAGGVSPRGIRHAVIYRDGILWHDPHPSREGIKSVDDVDILYPLDMPTYQLTNELAELREKAEALEWISHRMSKDKWAGTHYSLGVFKLTELPPVLRQMIEQKR